MKQYEALFFSQAIFSLVKNNSIHHGPFNCSSSSLSCIYENPIVYKDPYRDSSPTPESPQCASEKSLDCPEESKTFSSLWEKMRSAWLNPSFYGSLHRDHRRSTNWNHRQIKAAKCVAIQEKV